MSGLADDVRTGYTGAVLAVVGPPHSGKSVFLAELYRQLLQRRSTGIFLQRACPDGEGMWSSEAQPEVVAAIRRKGKFSPEFVELTLRAIERLGQNRQLDLVLLDLGGLRTAENAEILRRSTHGLIVSADEAETLVWQEFMANEGCGLLGVFASRLDETARSHIDCQGLPLRGTLVNLVRDGDRASYQGAVGAVADFLVAWCDEDLKSK
jgi:CRISPR-associated protein Csx3